MVGNSQTLAICIWVSPGIPFVVHAATGTYWVSLAVSLRNCNDFVMVQKGGIPTRRYLGHRWSPGAAPVQSTAFCLGMFYLTVATVHGRNPANHLGCIKPCK